MLRKVLVLVSVPVVGLGTANYVYQKRLKDNKAITPDDYHSAQLGKIQEALASEEALRSRRLTLFQYTTCPYCNKVKALLECNKVNYDVVEVDPLFKTEIKANGYGKVPQLRLGDDGPILVDSDQIVQFLAPILLSSNFGQEEESKKWTSWANNVLARYLVINTNRTLSESFQGYDYVDGVSDFGFLRKNVVKFVGGLSMYMVSNFITKKRLAQYGYAKGKDERSSLYGELNGWADTLTTREGGVLHGGLRPDLSDIEVYGILQSVQNFPVYKDITENCQPALGSWLQEMDQAAGKVAASE